MPSKDLVFTVLGRDRASRVFDQVGDRIDRLGNRALKVFGAMPAAAAAGAAGTAAALGGTAAGFIALGGVALRNNQQVKQSFASLSQEVQTGLMADAAPLADAYVGAAEDMGEAYQRLRPQMAQAFAASVPHVGELTGAVTDFAENAMPGMVRSVERAGPVFTGFRRLTGDAGLGLSQFLDEVSVGSADAGQGLAHLGDLVEGLLPRIGSGIRTLTGLWAEHGDEVVDSVIRVVDVLGQLSGGALPVVSSAFGVALDVLDGVLGVLEPISGALGPMIGMWLSVAAAIRLLRGAQGIVTGVAESVTTFAANTEKAAKGGSKLAVVGKSLLGVLGGPFGLALAGAGVLLAIFGQRQQEAAARAREYKQGVEALTSAYQQSNGALDSNVRATNDKALADKNAADNARAAGLSFRVYSEAANGNATALRVVTDQSNKMIRDVARTAKLTDEQTAAWLHANEVALSGADATEAKADAVRSLTTATEAGTTHTSNLTEAQLNQLDAIINGTSAVGQQIKQNAEARQAYLLLEEAASGLEISTIELMEAQQRQAAAARESMNASLSLADAVDQLEESEKAAAEAAKQHGKNSEEYDDAQRALAQSIDRVAAAEQAKAEATYAGTSETEKAQAGLEAYNRAIAEQVNRLGGDAPQAILDYVGTMNVAEAQAAGLRVATNDLGQTVVQLPDGKEIVISADVNGARADVRNFANETDAIHAQTTVGANVDPATGAVMDWRNTTSVTVGNTTTYTNIDPATGQVRTWKVETDSTGARTTTYSTTDPATGAVVTWRRNTNGMWATVNVNANTAAAERAINHVVRTRTGYIRMIVRTDGSVRYGGNIASAKGNLLMPMAEGGVLGGGARPMSGRLARMVPPGTLRVIGDNMRVAESFIPHDSSRRSRSLLFETNQRMGDPLGVQAAQELLRHIQGGGSMFEDFSFRGASSVVSRMNDQLAKEFYGAGGRFSRGAVSDFLRSKVAAGGGGKVSITLDTTGADEDFLRWLRKAIRVRGGLGGTFGG